MAEFHEDVSVDCRVVLVEERSAQARQWEGDHIGRFRCLEMAVHQGFSRSHRTLGMSGELWENRTVMAARGC
jgi:hypothetical protein